MFMTDENPPLSPPLAGEDYCYLTTTGRVTGKPHEIEIWFGLIGNTCYLLSGGMDKSDWVKNLLKPHPSPCGSGGRPSAPPPAS